MLLPPLTQRKKKESRLVKTNDDITLDTGSQVDFGLEVELDAEQKSGILELAVVVGSALDDLA
jgi:hypothetical protein